MGKLRLDINSTSVRGAYGIVDIVFNGTTLASTKQLSATVVSLEYNAEILTSSNNSLKISLLNAQANDANGDGEFTGPEDETMQAIVSALSYSTDDSNFITLLPQAHTSYTFTSGLLAGNVLTLTENVSSFTSYGLDHTVEFNSDGIVNSSYISGVRGKFLPDGNYQDFVNNKLYDPNGVEI